MERLEGLAAQIIADMDRLQGDADLEDEHDGREPDVDGEPSLGASEPTVDRVVFPWGSEIAENRIDPLDQTRWGLGDSDDLKEQCEDDGFDSDTEQDRADCG